MRERFPKKHPKRSFGCFFGSLFLAAAVSSLWLVVVATPVAAHAELLAADPSPGAVLAASPAEVRLTFSEPLLAGSTLVIFGEGFAQVAGISPVIDAQAPEQIGAAMPALSPGAYTVQWKAVSFDLHEVSGSYSFGVEVEEEGRGEAGVWWVLGVGAAGLLVLALYRRVHRG